MPFTKFLASRTSRQLKHTLRGVSVDFWPTFLFTLNPFRRRAIIQDLRRCHCVQDYVGFTRRWLGAGSVQLVTEIEAALDYVATESPRYVCEIGTDYGGTTLVLSHMLRSVELQIGIDLYVKNRLLLRALHRPDQRLHLINGSSSTQPTWGRVARLLKGDQLDALFIDGDHSYKGVTNDFLLYRRLVREDGFVMFHDILPDHETRYGIQSRAYSGGVPLLWTKLKDIYPSREFISDPAQDGMGIGVLRYSSSVKLPLHLGEDRWSTA